eukprot:scaffold538641_cov17-Prasinocladus_malaysianus.AAC.1
MVKSNFQNISRQDKIEIVIASTSKHYWSAKGLVVEWYPTSGLSRFDLVPDATRHAHTALAVPPCKALERYQYRYEYEYKKTHYVIYRSPYEY